MLGSVGLKYGIRIVANLPPGSGIPAPTLQTIGTADSALEKCFYMDYIDNGAIVTENYEKKFSLPICFAEVDVMDHKIKDFNWSISGGEAEYPMDIDCLLRKILETPEYQIIFKHVMNPSAIASMCTIISSTSFESSIGYKDGWEKVIENDPDGEEEDGPISFDDDDWQRKYFRNFQ